MRKKPSVVVRAVTTYGADPGRTMFSAFHALVHESPPGSVPGGAFDAGQGYRS